jgi:hypothetical protein
MPPLKLALPHHLAGRYFAGRTDNFRPSGGEEFLVATT